MCSEPVIEIRSLAKAYNIYKRPQDRLKQMLWRRRRRFYEEYWAIHDISLSVAPGETVGIVGRNGSGKSTLLQMIAGTVTPTQGTVAVRGRVAALLELGAGFNPEFTGRENVWLAASILGLGNAEIAARLQDIVDFAAIGDFLDQPVKLYSSGMFARLAFAVAAHVDADVLIVDETLSVGDAAFNQKCMRFIRAFKARGTLLFVSHDMAAVTALCDRVIWIDRGALRAEGSAKETCFEYLAAMDQDLDDSSSFRVAGRRLAPEPARIVQDPRRALLDSSVHRNEIDLFEFDEEARSYGRNGARILDVGLEDVAGSRLAALVGGEDAVLHIRCRALADVARPIVGFQIKDRLGQFLFGDNTYLTYRLAPMPMATGQEFSARFHFQMPYLPTGDYSVVAAIAEGTQVENVAHHWIDDALFFRVQSSHVARGLVGIPMLDIAIVADSGALKGEMPAEPGHDHPPQPHARPLDRGISDGGGGNSRGEQ
ncbi:MAG: lipopolysaccharide transport system ATP-binding protein [Aliidongia sp.]|nr:lipopolysaccharide transport system ATP-binding protein [Aliidongia sp.]